MFWPDVKEESVGLFCILCYTARFLHNVSGAGHRYTNMFTSLDPVFSLMRNSRARQVLDFTSVIACKCASVYVCLGAYVCRCLRRCVSKCVLSNHKCVPKMLVPRKQYCINLARTNLTTIKHCNGVLVKCILFW